MRGMNYEVHDALLMLQRKVFLNKGLKFLKEIKIDAVLFNYQAWLKFKSGQILRVQPFGTLLVLEDSFIREVEFLRR